MIITTFELKKNGEKYVLKKAFLGRARQCSMASFMVMLMALWLQEKFNVCTN